MNVALLLALVGWFVTFAGWWISSRNQQRLFRHQVRNGARGEIVKALREWQDAVLTLRRAILRVHLDARIHPEPGVSRWAFEQWRSVSAADLSRWIMLLEEYEVAFPHTAGVRSQLVARNLRLTEDVARFFLGIADDDMRARAIPDAEPLMDRLGDESGLAEDLLVYIQNEALGGVFDAAVSFRRPLEARAIRIVVGKGGHLELTRDENAAAAAGPRRLGVEARS